MSRVAQIGGIAETLLMSSAESILSPRGLEMSRRAYHQLGERGAFEGLRVQLVNGTVIVMSPMGTPHAFMVAKLSRHLFRQAPEQFDVRVQLPIAASDDSEPEPDFAIVEADMKPGADHPTTASLIIEVADSSLTLDLGPKARLYAACRVAEYWVIDLKTNTLVVHRSPQRGRYTSVRRHDRTRTVNALQVPGVTLRLNDFLR